MAAFRVYFDGKCVLCSREIEFYRKQSGAEALEWVDISYPGFDAKAEGLDPLTVMRVFHVRNELGELVTGVDGFIEIWKRLPALSLWVKGSKLPGARTLMKWGYQVFIRVRPWLPRREEDCPDGYCATGRSAQKIREGLLHDRSTP
ncbi:MAG: hypothetical protein RJB38_1594 [Pseudomonadota bacterium]|jgi:predicted DCC family thiol-disulfide oxidoreductase YuxK